MSSGAAWVTGVRSVGVGTSLKHFALNNAETDRMRSSSDIDPRPMHEVYLRAFSHIVRTAHPWTVMCSYNRINGAYAAENRWLLTELLRETWVSTASWSATGCGARPQAPQSVPVSIWRCRERVPRRTPRSSTPSAPAS